MDGDLDNSDIGSNIGVRRTPTNVKQIEIKTGNAISKKKSNPEEFYQQIQDLGEGAFGRVIKVKQIMTGEFRALKIVDKSLLHEEMSEEEIENEIKILKSLDHPNIIKVYDFFDYKDNLFIVNEFIGDGDLFKLVEQLKFLNESLSLKILHQLLSAVCYLHSNSIIHGDIKPENVMIDNYKNSRISNKGSDIFGFDIKLIDFGTSKIINKPKVLHNLVGTAYYVAPEVILGSYHKQCDLWSCGVVLYIMLSGTFPFQGESEEEIFNNIKFSKPNMSIELITNASNETQQLLLQLLNKDPIERITAAQALESKAFDKLKVLKNEANHKIFSSKNTMNALKRLNTNNENKFQQAITSFITHNFLSKEVMLKHKEIFKAIDNNGDGQITKAELIEGYKKFGGDFDIETIENVIDNLDRDNNGFIEEEEFAAATVDIKEILTKNNIKFSFQSIDKDNSGFISVDEVGCFIGGEDYDKELIIKVIEEAKKDPTKEISLSDFEDIMNVLLEKSSGDQES